LELVGNLALALFALVMTANIGDALALRGADYAPVEDSSSLRGWFAVEGRDITNIYPFDEKGRLLTGIYLVDQDGHPINLVGRYEDRVTLFPTDPQGNPVRNRYPAEQRVGDPMTGDEHGPPVPTFRPPERLTPPRDCPSLNGIPPEK